MLLLYSNHLYLSVSELAYSDFFNVAVTREPKEEVHAGSIPAWTSLLAIPYGAPTAADLLK
jgi:hypothetical protein